jgi:hypothetical protein
MTVNVAISKFTGRRMTALLYFDEPALGSLMDVPEILIVAGILAGFAWAVYNWTHRVQH